MGTAAEFMITPYGSLIVGFCCGIISTFGYVFVSVSNLQHYNKYIIIFFTLYFERVGKRTILAGEQNKTVFFY